MILKAIGRWQGEHVHVRLFMGEQEEHLAGIGSLVCRVDEWRILEKRLRGLHDSDWQFISIVLPFHDSRGKRVRIRKKTTFDDVKASATKTPAKIWASEGCGWWTHHAPDTHLGHCADSACSHRVYLQEYRFLEEAQKSSRFGRHGLDAFMAAHADNCINEDGKSTCLPSWEQYNHLLDDSGDPVSIVDEKLGQVPLISDAFGDAVTIIASVAADAMLSEEQMKELRDDEIQELVKQDPDKFLEHIVWKVRRKRD